MYTFPDGAGSFCPLLTLFMTAVVSAVSSLSAAPRDSLVSASLPMLLEWLQV